MQLDDRIVGLILVALGAAVFLIARDFPLMAGMPYGPGFFPSIASVGMIVCGIIIAITGGLKARARATAGPAVAAPPDPDKPALPSGPGVWLRPAAIMLCVVFFGLAMPVLGFHIAAVITVAAAAYVFGAHPIGGLVLAVAAAFAAHAAFYSMLRVPLPWGILTPYAW